MRKIDRFQKIWKQFGWKAAFGIAVSSFYPYEKHQNSASYLILQMKHRYIFKALEKECLRLRPGDADRHSGMAVRNKTRTESAEYPACIWTFWWQGYAAMPEPIQLSIQNMKRFSNGHPVIVVTQDNWEEYVKLPGHVVKKFQEGTISITHFSDILRMNLLGRHGGLWLDAGIFPVSKIDEDIFQKRFFTRRVSKQKEANISDSRWCAGLIGGMKGYPFFLFMAEAFHEYWRRHDFMIDYFLIDYLMAVGYQHMGKFRSDADAVRFNNRGLFDFEALLNESYVKQSGNVRRILLEGNFARLKWRNAYRMETSDGLETVYAHLFRQEKAEHDK